MRRTIAAPALLALAGCTSSPPTDITIHGPLTIVTYVTGDGCHAERGSSGAQQGTQDVSGGADANVTTQTGTGTGTVAQGGTAEALLASRVGCDERPDAPQ